MKWSYVAGFVDGEGCFSVGSHGKQMSLTMAQRSDRAAVLDLIAAKLDYYNISYSWYEGINNTGCKYTNLVISKQSSLKKIVLKLMPHLVVKRSDAEAALEWLKSKDEARKQRESFCKYGHPRTDENIYTHAKTGKRSCLMCREIRSKGRSVPGYTGSGPVK